MSRADGHRARIAGAPYGTGATRPGHAGADHPGTRTAPTRLTDRPGHGTGGHRPRHVLLPEAVAGGLLPGERAGLHERTARALAAAGDDALAAEAAGHWQAAGRPAGEFPARVAAAATAERVFGYAEAAMHWQRTIELWPVVPDAAVVAGIELPQVYVRAVGALFLSGDGARAAVVAEEAYGRFADHRDPAIAGSVCHRAAFCRSFDAPGTGLPLIEEALRLYGRAPPSADHADALMLFAHTFLRFTEQQVEASVPALTRALEMAEAAGATALIPRILATVADNEFWHGQIGEGLAVLERGWAVVHACGDPVAWMWLAVAESEARLKLAQFQNAAEVALRGIQAARQAGLGASWKGIILAVNAADALLALGRTAEAAALIDPLTAGPPNPNDWVVHETRAEIDLLCGDIDAAARRLQLIGAIPGHMRSIEDAREGAQRAAELALWAGRPGAAVAEVR